MATLETPPEQFDYSEYLKGTEWELPIDLNIGSISEQAATVVSAGLREAGWDEDTVIDLEIGFREALANALKYGKPESVENAASARIHVRFTITPERVSITIQDPGKGFKWQEVVDPRTKEGQDLEHSRGIFLMRQKFDSVEYNNKGNSVTMSFGDEGLIGPDPDKLFDSLPERLKGKGARMYLANDGSYHWHAEPADMHNEKKRDTYRAEQHAWDETS